MAEKVDRLTRVNVLLKRELAGLIERDLIVPAGMLVSVTETNVSVDLRNATVQISIFGGKASDRQAVMQELAERRPEFQSRLGKTLAFKRTPVLDFRHDTRMAKGDQVLELLHKADEEDAGSDEQ